MVVQHEVDRHLAGVAVVASDRVGAQQVHVDRAVVEDAVDDRGQHGSPLAAARTTTRRYSSGEPLLANAARPEPPKTMRC